MSSESIRKRAREVLGYFLCHPCAVDTVEGLARWRLLDAAIRQSVRDTHEALAWLVAHGVVVEETPPGSQPIFRLNSASVEAAREIWSALAEGGSRKPDGSSV